MNSERSIQLLRTALGIIFVWFGILKIFNSSPVAPLINAVSPISFPMEIPLLGLFEIAIGAGFFTKRFYKISALVMMGFLAVITFLVLVFKGFSPWFPLLSYDGEFALKNLAFIAAGWVLIAHKTEILHSVQNDKESKNE